MQRILDLVIRTLAGDIQCWNLQDGLHSGSLPSGGLQPKLNGGVHYFGHWILDLVIRTLLGTYNLGAYTGAYNLRKTLLWTLYKTKAWPVTDETPLISLES